MLNRLILLIFLSVLSFSTWAEKPGLVLLPIQGPDLSEVERQSYRLALQESFSLKYKVYSGNEVDQRLKKTAKAQKICDAEKCLQDVALHYQAELVGRGVIIKQVGGYMLSMEIINVLSGNEVVQSKSEPCEGCNQFAVVRRLKEMGSPGMAGGGISVKRIESTARTSQDASAIVILDSEPTGARVVQDGIEIGVTPYQAFDFKAGQRFAVELEKQFYETHVINAPVRAGVNELPIQALRPNFGSLLVESDPSGAKAVLTEPKRRTQVAAVVTPGRLKAEPGNYRLSISKDGYVDIAFDIQIEKGRTARIGGQQATLARQMGKVFVTTEPLEKGAAIWVAGKRVGQVPARLTLPVGEIEIEVVSKKETLRQKIDVKSAYTQTVKIPLTRVPEQSKVAAKASSAGITANAARPRVRLSTNMGDMVLELNRDKAPVSVENFLGYVKSGFYDGTIFHRVIKGFMNQGGGFTPDMNKKSVGSPIKNEADNGLKNSLGTVAMARTSDPHSATAQFFINTTNNKFLNFSARNQRGWGYAVFGEVVEGMDVVDKISRVSTGTVKGYQDVPRKPIVINRAIIE